MTFTRRPTWDSGRVRVAILGPLQVEDDAGRPVEIGGARLRTLLTRLALDAGRAVSAGALVAALWGDAPPADEANALQSLVSRLRRTLPDASAGPVRSRPATGSRCGRRRPTPPGSSGSPPPATTRSPRATRPAPPTCSGRRSRSGEARRSPTPTGCPGRSRPGPRWTERRLAAAEDRYRGRARARAARRRGAGPGAPRRRAPAAGAARAASCSAPCTRPVGRPRRWPPTRTSAGGWPTSSASTPRPSCRRSTSRCCAPILPWPRRPPGAVPAPTCRPSSPASSAGMTTRRRRRPARPAPAGHPGRPGWLGQDPARRARSAVRLLDRFPDGVWLAELAPVTGGDQVPQAVLAALGLPSRRDRRPMRRRRGTRSAGWSTCSPAADALIVLDNCEHLIEAAARTAGRAARPLPGPAGPGHQPGAARHHRRGAGPVAPLGLPPADATAASRRWRTRRSGCSPTGPPPCGPGFAVDDGTVGRRGGDLPPAGRAAAGHRAGRGPAAVAAGRARSPPGWTTGSGCSPAAAAPRCRGTRRCARSSTGAGTCSTTPSARAGRPARRSSPAASARTRAEAVCAGRRRAGRGRARPARRAGRQVAAAAVAGAEPRYRMLETIREYGAGAARRGRRGGRGPAGARRALPRASPRTPSRTCAAASSWTGIARLTAEQDNLLAALRFAVDTGDADTAIRLGAALAWYWTAARRARAAAHPGSRRRGDLPGDGARPDARAVCLAVGAVSARRGRRQTSTGSSSGWSGPRALNPGTWRATRCSVLLEPLARDARRRRARRRSSCSERAPEPTDPWARATALAASARCCTRTTGHFEEHRADLEPGAGAATARSATGGGWPATLAATGERCSSPTATWRARSRRTRRPTG